MLDSNTYYLNEYHDNQDRLESLWEATKQDKRDAVVDLATKLIRQEVAPEFFNWVFCDYLESDPDNLYEVLEHIDNKKLYDYYHTRSILMCALEGACTSLYDCELEEIDGEDILSDLDSEFGLGLHE